MNRIDISFHILLNNSDFQNVLNENWPAIANNLPQVKQGRLKRIDYDLPKESKWAVSDFIRTRAISSKDLYESFKSVSLDAGLHYFNEPETDLIIVDKSPDELNIKNGDKISIHCEARGYPSPKYKFYLNDQFLCDGNTFTKDKVTFMDSGDYKCVMKQFRRNGTVLVKEVIFKVDVEKIDLKEMMIKVSPTSIELKPGETAEISVNLDDNYLDNFKFEWFRYSPNIPHGELVENFTDSLPKLVIENFSPSDGGYYKCLITNRLTNQKAFSYNSCSVSQVSESEYDLKICFMIGNGMYETRDEMNGSDYCERCAAKYDELDYLDIYQNSERMKHELEKLDFIVISFVDLNDDEYFSVIHLFRRIIDLAHKAFVMVYVAGHGHHIDHNDFLIPINSKSNYHKNQHVEDEFLSDTFHCSFKNLIRILTDDSGERFTVTVLWDLCRIFGSSHQGQKKMTDKDPVDFSGAVIYASNAGKPGYCLNSDMDDFRLRKGTIFSNLFLKNLQPNYDLYQIGQNMDRDIQKLKRHPEFAKLNLLKCESSLKKINLSVKANENKKFYQKIKMLYYNERPDLYYQVEADNRTLFSYRFLRDTFVNTILLEIMFQIPVVNFNIKTDSLFSINLIHQGDSFYYRIGNILRPELQKTEPMLSLLVDLVDGRHITYWLNVSKLSNHIKTIQNELNAKFTINGNSLKEATTSFFAGGIQINSLSPNESLCSSTSSFVNYANTDASSSSDLSRTSIDSSSVNEIYPNTTNDDDAVYE